MYKGRHRAKFKKDHNKLNDLFNAYYNSKENNQIDAKKTFEKFANILHSHILWEERILFPVLEKKLGGYYLKVVDTAKEEHCQLVDYLKILHEKLQKGDKDTEKDEDDLMSTLLKHEDKEEKILHSEIIKHLSEDEIKQALNAMNKIQSDIFISGQNLNSTVGEIVNE